MTRLISGGTGIFVTETNTIKILIVDDHALFLEGLSFALDGLSGDVEIITAKSATEAFDKIKSHKDLHLTLLDLDLPDMHGIEVLKRLSIDAPTLPVVILSASEHYADMKSALNTGAMGYIPKTEKSSVMLHAVQLALEGSVYVPPKLLNSPPIADNSLMDERNQRPESNEQHKASSTSTKLTPRQLEIFAYVGEGYTNKEIARLIDVTEATVKSHVTTALKLLNTKNRVSALKVLRELGIQLPSINGEH